jgi:hypothetical protein
MSLFRDNGFRYNSYLKTIKIQKQLLTFKQQFIMKNFKLFSIAFAFVFIFSSCSFNEDLIIEENPTALLKSFTIERAVNGAYSLGYELSGNALAENKLDVQKNTNEIHLYASDIKSEKSNKQQDLTLKDNEINVTFFDANTEEKPQITILDTSIQMARNTADEQLVDAYSFTSNDDGTVDLDFHVKEKVEVSFVFNEAARVYEIHLVEGNGTIANFDRTFTKAQGEALHVAFVNHFEDSSAARNPDGFTRRIKRPEWIIN